MAAPDNPRPLIALSACVREIGIHPFHVVGEKYITAVRDGAQGLALMMPSLLDEEARADLLARVDGLLFTGSLSNVEPHLYDGPPSAEGTHHDAQRDATTLPLAILLPESDECASTSAVPSSEPLESRGLASGTS